MERMDRMKRMAKIKRVERMKRMERMEGMERINCSRTVCRAVLISVSLDFSTIFPSFPLLYLY